jgi:hypothetical protein
VDLAYPASARGYVGGAWRRADSVLNRRAKAQPSAIVRRKVSIPCRWSVGGRCVLTSTSHPGVPM